MLKIQMQYIIVIEDGNQDKNLFLRISKDDMNAGKNIPVTELRFSEAEAPSVIAGLKEALKSLEETN